jgi:hypothetical protein
METFRMQDGSRHQSLYIFISLYLFLSLARSLSSDIICIFLSRRFFIVSHSAMRLLASWLLFKIDVCLFLGLIIQFFTPLPPNRFSARDFYLQNTDTHIYIQNGDNVKSHIALILSFVLLAILSINIYLSFSLSLYFGHMFIFQWVILVRTPVILAATRPLLLWLQFYSMRWKTNHNFLRVLVTEEYFAHSYTWLDYRVRAESVGFSAGLTSNLKWIKRFYIYIYYINTAHFISLLSLSL